MATQVGSDMLITGGDLTMNTTTAPAELGTRGVDAAGNSYRLVLAGGTALVPGKLQQAPAQTAGFQNLTPTATAVAATSLTTSSTLTATANQLAGGWVMVTVTPGQGQRLLISSHPAASAAALTLTLSDAVVTALTTSSRIDLQVNPFSGVIVNPATASSAPLGVAVTAVTAAQYGWIQTSGVANVLADGAVTVGTALVASNAVAGAVEPLTGVQASVALALTDISDTEYGAVLLNFR